MALLNIGRAREQPQENVLADVFGLLPVSQVKVGDAQHIVRVLGIQPLEQFVDVSLLGHLCSRTHLLFPYIKTLQSFRFLHLLERNFSKKAPRFRKKSSPRSLVEKARIYPNQIK